MLVAAVCWHVAVVGLLSDSIQTVQAELALEIDSLAKYLGRNRFAAVFPRFFSFFYLIIGSIYGFLGSRSGSLQKA